MKRLVIVGILAVLASSLAVCGYAQSGGTGFYTQLNFLQPTVGSQILDLQSLGVWDVLYTGSATVSSTNATAMLVGNYSGKVWQYEYTPDASSATTNWFVVGSLVDSMTALPGTTSSSGVQNGGPVTVTARWLKISYDATLSSPGGYFANASGSGTISATAVPEPSSLLILGSMLAPMGIRILRKRS